MDVAVAPSRVQLSHPAHRHGRIASAGACWTWNVHEHRIKVGVSCLSAVLLRASRSYMIAVRRTRSISRVSAHVHASADHILDNEENLWELEESLTKRLDAHEEFLNLPEWRRALRPHETFAEDGRSLRLQRAEVRLKLRLYDAALADADCAHGLDGAVALCAAARIGMHCYEEHVLAALDGCLGTPATAALIPSEEDEQSCGSARETGNLRAHAEKLRKQCHGDFDYKDIYWRERWPAILPPLAEYVGPVETATCEPYGIRGVRALRDIERGELLLVSPALVRTMPWFGQKVSRMSAWARHQAAERKAMEIYARASSISPHTKYILGSVLSDGSSRTPVPLELISWSRAFEPQEDRTSPRPPHVSYAGINSTNAFSEIGGYESLFPTTSMINHDCLPNAFVLKVGETSIVRARRRVRAGEQITISYFETLKPVCERKRITQNWKFECGCSRCQLESEVDLQRFDNFVSNIESMTGAASVIQSLEASVSASGLSPHAINVCLAGYATLYLRYVEQTGDSAARQRLLDILEAVNPGSFLHCKVALLDWEAQLGASGTTYGDCEVEGRVQMWSAEVGSEKAKLAWRRCAEVHRLRYGHMDDEGVCRLMDETRAAILKGSREFCLSSCSSK